MDTPHDSPAFLGALSSEQFMLESIAGSTISEGGTRSSIYLSTLSGGLVAIGFASSSPDLLTAFVLTVLPTIFVLGCFTVVRLVDTSVENIAVSRRIERIRSYYATLGPVAAAVFAAEDPLTNGKFGVRYSRWSVLFTMASMIAVVNAVVAGAICALILSLLLGVTTAFAALTGVVVGGALLTATLVYQRRRIARLDMA
ncbi:hypothetical protein ACFVWR_18075 [Leifsonia sp. NPDC058292]|uniref:hypothetical protein n=1 Tax=Leifsonia sp. NPDC058292 TaxID=3346428 RepID=UPI0036DC6421